MVVKSFETLDYGLFTQYIFLFLLWKWFTFDYKLLDGNLNDNWSTWLIFSDKLSPHPGNLFLLSDFPRQAVYTWGDNFSTWVIFPDMLSPHGEIKVIFIWCLVLISYPFERIKKWLTAPFMVFPYMVRGNKQLFLTIILTNTIIFLALLESSWLKSNFQTFLFWKNC